MDLSQVQLEQSKIWKLKIHEHLKMNLWHIATNVLPFLDRLVTFSPNLDSTCCLCGQLKFWDSRYNILIKYF